MSPPCTLEPPTPETRRRLATLADRTLSREEFEAYVSAPMNDAERDAIQALVRWFTRRYPTAGERLAYVRAAYARWTGAAEGD